MQAHIVSSSEQRPSFQKFVPKAVTLNNLFSNISQKYFGYDYQYPSLSLVHFWAIWCQPCLEELPELIQFASRYPNIKFILISMDQDPGDTRALVTSYRDDEANIVYLNDSSGSLALHWGTTMLPETYLLNHKGEVFQRMIGPMAWKQKKFRKYFNSLISKFSPSEHEIEPLQVTQRKSSLEAISKTY